MERPIVYCDRCHELTVLGYDPIYKDGHLVGELVRHYCHKCNRVVRTHPDEMLKREIRDNGG
jgi:hypothetical protein